MAAATRLSNSHIASLKNLPIDCAENAIPHFNLMRVPGLPSPGCGSRRNLRRFRTVDGNQSSSEVVGDVDHQPILPLKEGAKYCIS
jgi:hypothetical protein